MPLNLTNLLNSAPVSPPHSHCHNTNTGPSPKELSLLLSPETQANQFINQIKSITPTQPATYNLNKKHLLKSTSYQRPVPITSFSYDQHRRIHTGNNQFLSLSPLLSPPDLIGLNLAHQIDQAIYQDESIDEALDGLLISLVDFLDKADPKDRLDHCRGVLSAGLITWRGILTKLCASVYENGRGGWTQEVMMVDGTVYMVDMKEQEEEEEEEKKGGSSREQTYYGYSYENLVTSPPGRVQPVNTNVQWVAVVKANLNRTRIILGGEVDCVQSDAFNKLQQPADQDNHTSQIQTHQFIEIKTSILPSSDRDYFNLYRFKMLKFWLQSYLLGVPKIHVGMRDRSGIVRGVQEYMTLGIPGLVREAQRQTAGGRWSAECCLGGGAGIVEFVMGKLRKDAAGATDTRLGRCEARLRDIVAEEVVRQRREPPGRGHGHLSEACRAQMATLREWPVYSLVFRPSSKPGQPGSLQLFERPARPSSKPFSHSLFGYQHPLLRPSASPASADRIGFLPDLWIAYLVQTRVQLALQSDPLPTS
ncbi:hypothetical protein VP01_3264g1 [Puccinia sorghi]|uniref:Decapping nuclease n=1 Tax=Puccinia sorghi TaxID=27349 RepID=A0A0L6UXW0_9BASI|nr:hypothetical protein VP01_3264g1 [Puccinia sorghi]